MKFTTKDLSPALWDDVESLFGKRGACAGCWCMFWRLKKGQSWDDTRGPKAKKLFKGLVQKRKANGILAYDGDKPVGWCSYDKRTDFDKLDRSPSFTCEDANKVWSIPCFFIKPGYRNQGVAKALLGHALKTLKKKGAKVAEGYPVKPTKSGKDYPAAFAWTGTRPLFTKKGFKIVGNKDGGKQRVRIEL